MMRHNLFIPMDIFTDLSSPKALSGISIGLVVSLMIIVIEISFAAMIFSGPLEVYAQRGMGLTLAGALVLTVSTALFSGFRPNVSSPQDAPVAIFAGAAAGIAVSLGTGQSQTAFITVVAALMIASMATAVFFFLAARTGLSKYIRFMPYPVVAGFLAGTGWLLTKGSLEVMTGLTLSWHVLPSLLSSNIILLWLPGALYALLLFFCLKRWSHFLILPGSMILALILYHLTLPLLGLNMEQAREIGLFFTSFPSSSIWPAFSPADFAHVQWSAILREIPILAVIPFIALIGMLLNTGGIELAAQKDLDLNRELMVSSGGNALAALTGSPAGYNTLSLSMLGFKTGADTRIVGLTAAIIIGVTLFFGGQVLSIFPKALLGGFLLLLGLLFLSDWIVDTRLRMPLSDYIIVLLVFATIGLFGYLYGVLLGLMATLILFTTKISSIPAVSSSSSITHARSRRTRPLPHQQILTIHGQQAHFFELSGYLFFGSVSSLTTAVSNVLQNRTTRFIIVDFQKVTGFDVSAVNNFVRLAQQISSQNMLFVFAGPSKLFQNLFRQIGGSELSDAYLIFPDINSALEWCEESIIADAQAAVTYDPAQTRKRQEDLFEQVADDLLKELEQQEQLETLLKKIEGYLKSRSFAAGQKLLAQGDLSPGIMFVQQGTVTEKVIDSSGRSTALRTLRPGMLFSEASAYTPMPSHCDYVAETPVRIALLTPEALLDIERHDPDTAQKIHRQVIAALISARTAI